MSNASTEWRQLQHPRLSYFFFSIFPDNLMNKSILYVRVQTQTWHKVLTVKIIKRIGTVRDAS